MVQQITILVHGQGVGMETIVGPLIVFGNLMLVLHEDLHSETIFDFISIGFSMELLEGIPFGLNDILVRDD